MKKTPPFKDMVLKTQRLTLIPITLENADPIFKILKSFPELTKYLTFEPPQHKTDTETFIRYAQQNMNEKKAMTWVIQRDEKLIGVVGLDDIVYHKLAWTMGNCDLGYWLSPDYHRQGIMYESLQAVLKCAFQDLQIHKIYANHVTENQASGNLLKKLGFRYVGERREHFYRFDRWWNYTMYELINPDEKNE